MKICPTSQSEFDAKVDSSHAMCALALLVVLFAVACDSKPAPQSAPEAQERAAVSNAQALGQAIRAASEQAQVGATLGLAQSEAHQRVGQAGEEAFDRLEAAYNLTTKTITTNAARPRNHKRPSRVGRRPMSSNPYSAISDRNEKSESGPGKSGPGDRSADKASLKTFDPFGDF